MSNLPGGVLIPYYLPDGSLAPRQRMRTTIDAEDGSYWLPGEGEPVPYGLQLLSEIKKKGYCFLVEDEDDVWDLGLYKFPAIGIPDGIVTWTLDIKYLEEIKYLYIVQKKENVESTSLMQ